MKAYVINEFGIQNLSLEERPDPQPAAGEVLIKFHAASVNFRDLMVVKGTYNPRMKLPAIPFSDGAGEIIAVGEGVTRWSVGDRVMPIFAQRWFDGPANDENRRTALGADSQWDGVLRDFGAFSEESVVAIPQHLSYEEAATLPCAAITAWHAIVESGKAKAGEKILTLGTGGVSIFALQFAKMLGLEVISTSGSDEKIEKLKELGADHTINYRTTPDWDKAVLEITDRVGVDHVVEVGGAGTVRRSLNAVRTSGHVAMIGALSGGEGIDPVSVFMKLVRLQGIFTGSRRMFEDMNKAISENKLKPVIDRVFAFNDVAAALEYMESGSHFGKIVISFA